MTIDPSFNLNNNNNGTEDMSHHFMLDNASNIKMRRGGMPGKFRDPLIFRTGETFSHSSNLVTEDAFSDVHLDMWTLPPLAALEQAIGISFENPKIGAGIAVLIMMAEHPECRPKVSSLINLGNAALTTAQYMSMNLMGEDFSNAMKVEVVDLADALIPDHSRELRKLINLSFKPFDKVEFFFVLAAGLMLDGGITKVLMLFTKSKLLHEGHVTHMQLTSSQVGACPKGKEGSNFGIDADETLAKKIEGPIPKQNGRCLHGNAFIPTRCSLMHRCKLLACTNRNVCRESYWLTECGCKRSVPSSSDEDWNVRQTITPIKRGSWESRQIYNNDKERIVWFQPKHGPFNISTAVESPDFTKE